MTTREALLAEAAWNYLVKDHPWVAKDEYYKKNPHKSMTYNAAIWGANWEAQRSAVLLEALEKAKNQLWHDFDFLSSKVHDENAKHAHDVYMLVCAALSSYRAKRVE